jgi:hypothetical protein
VQGNEQPFIRLNVGQGNSFIVKNSNIVITSNSINKASLSNPPVNPMLVQNNGMNFNHPIIEKE